MSKHFGSFALVAVMLLGTVGGAVAGDGSVRFLTAGPVRLGDGHIGHMRVFLPAVQRSIPVHFLGEEGLTLKTLEVKPPPRGKGPFFEVIFEAHFTGGILSITDGTSNTLVHQGPSEGIIAILIGLRNARGMGTMEVLDSDGKHVFILPYIEQDNLFRR